MIRLKRRDSEETSLLIPHPYLFHRVSPTAFNIRINHHPRLRYLSRNARQTRRPLASLLQPAVDRNLVRCCVYSPFENTGFVDGIRVEKCNRFINRMRFTNIIELRILINRVVFETIICRYRLKSCRAFLFSDFFGHISRVLL